MRHLGRSPLSKHFPPSGASHPGHAISRLSQQKAAGQADDQKADLKLIVNIGLPEGYTAALGRWQQNIVGATTLSATTRGPLAIGLGNASPYEVGLTLHHTYGVPYLPGAALKGLTLRAARQYSNLSQEEIDVIFGTSDAAGYITFWDGWLGADAEKPLQLDTITVHHPKYYQNGGEWPTDFDDPIPVPFLSVRPDVTFHIALSGPDRWATLAAQLLGHGLTHLGLGGKTNAGYGGFSVERRKSEGEREAEKLQEEKQLEEAREAQAAKAFEGRADELKARSKGPKNAKREANNLLNITKTWPTPQRRGVLEYLLNELGADERPDAGLVQKVKKALEEPS